MKILIFSLNFTPEITGVGKYSGEMATWLSKKSDVRVITTHPYYPSPQTPNIFISKWTREVIDGVTVYRCPLLVPHNNSGFLRMLHLGVFALFSMPVALWQIFWRPHIIIAIQPTSFCLPIALIVSKFSNAKAILHIQDFELDAAFKLDFLKDNFLKSFAFFLEKWLIRRFDFVTTISENMIKVAIKKGVEKSKIALFPNWINFDYFSIKKSSDNYKHSFRDELNIDNRALIALYSGSMGRKQGLNILAEVAKLAANERRLVSNPIHFIFCGEGPYRQQLIEGCVGVPNVHFLKFQPYEDLVRLFDSIDIHLLPQKAGVADLVLPSKLTGMLASGKPIIATASSNTELSKIVQNCGLVVEPENAEFLLEGLVELAGNREMRRRFGNFAREYAIDNLDKESILSDFFRDVILELKPSK